MGYELVAGDTGSKLVVTCRDNQTKALIDLTGMTVDIRWKINGSTLVSKAMNVLSPATDAKAEYQFGVSELTAGTMAADIRITDGSGKTLTSLNPLRLPIRAPLS